MPANLTITSLFDQLKTEADLRALIHAGVQEGLYLEFKQKRDATKPELSPSDAANFSKALSGFANADGGVLVWGVKTDKAERATDLEAIAAALRFQAALKSSIANSTQPVVDEVKVEVIPSVGAGGDSYIKCLIPASEKIPHRAMLSEREYYRRSSEGFYRMEHFDLEDAFGRRPRPALEIAVRIEPGSSTGGYGGRTQTVNIYLTIQNIGRGSAHAPFIQLTVPAPYIVRPHGISSPGPTEPLLRWVQEGEHAAKFLGTADFIIHPNTSFDFAVVCRTFSDQVINEGNLEISIEMAAEGWQLRPWHYTRHVAELLTAVRWTAFGPA